MSDYSDMAIMANYMQGMVLLKELRIAEKANNKEKERKIIEEMKILLIERDKLSQERKSRSKMYKIKKLISNLFK